MTGAGAPAREAVEDRAGPGRSEGPWSPGCPARSVGPGPAQSAGPVGAQSRYLDDDETRSAQGLTPEEFYNACRPGGPAQRAGLAGPVDSQGSHGYGAPTSCKTKQIIKQSARAACGLRTRGVRVGPMKSIENCAK